MPQATYLPDGYPRLVCMLRASRFKGKGQASVLVTAGPPALHSDPRALSHHGPWARLDGLLLGLVDVLAHALLHAGDPREELLRRPCDGLLAWLLDLLLHAVHAPAPARPLHARDLCEEGWGDVARVGWCRRRLATRSRIFALGNLMNRAARKGSASEGFRRQIPEQRQRHGTRTARRAGKAEAACGRAPPHGSLRASPRCIRVGQPDVPVAYSPCAVSCAPWHRCSHGHSPDAHSYSTTWHAPRTWRGPCAWLGCARGGSSRAGHRAVIRGRGRPNYTEAKWGSDAQSHESRSWSSRGLSGGSGLRLAGLDIVGAVFSSIDCIADAKLGVGRDSVPPACSRSPERDGSPAEPCGQRPSRLAVQAAPLRAASSGSELEGGPGPRLATARVGGWARRQGFGVFGVALPCVLARWRSIEDGLAPLLSAPFRARAGRPRRSQGRLRPPHHRLRRNQRRPRRPHARLRRPCDAVLTLGCPWTHLVGRPWKPKEDHGHPWNA